VILPFTNDSDIFLEILDHTFCPSGLSTVQKYKLVISSKPMTGPFTSETAATFSFHVFSINSVLNTKLVSQMHVIHDFWKVICDCVEDSAFQYSLKTQTPASFNTFWSVIESRAAIFDQSDSPTGYLQRQNPSNLRSNKSPSLPATPQNLSLPRPFHHSAPRNSYPDHTHQSLSFSDRPEVNMVARFDSNPAPSVTACRSKMQFLPSHWRSSSNVLPAH
jgi:hypothetical protein